MKDPRDELRNRKRPLDVRLSALRRVGPDPEVAPAALDLIEDLVDRKKRLVDVPDEVVLDLVGPAEAVRLRSLYERVRARYDSSAATARSRIADQVLLHRWLGRAAGGTMVPPGTLRDGEVPCPGCRWPSLLYCRKCKVHFCGREECAPAPPPNGPVDRLVCGHEDEAGETFSAIRNDSRLDLPVARAAPAGEPFAGDPIALGPDWTVLGTVAVDSGRVGVVPVGGGAGLSLDTGIGDGTFPIEGRLGPGGEPELRIRLDPTGSSGGRSSPAGVAASRSGCFVIGDPVVRAPLDAGVARRATESSPVAEIDGAIVVPAAAVVASRRRSRDRLLEVLLRFRPVIHAPTRRTTR